MHWFNKAKKLTENNVYSYSYRKSTIDEAIDHLRIGEQDDNIINSRECSKLRECIESTQSSIQKVYNLILVNKYINIFSKY